MHVNEKSCDWRKRALLLFIIGIITFYPVYYILDQFIPEMYLLFFIPLWGIIISWGVIYAFHDKYIFCDNIFCRIFKGVVSVGQLP